MPSGCKPETVLELPMSVNKAPLEWRHGRIEKMPGATGLSLTCTPVGKPSLIKGRWQASFKYVCVLSYKKQTQKRIYKVHKASHP